MNDSTSFEDRLWDALVREAGRPTDELPADRLRVRPARRAVTARRAGFGLAAAAIAGATLVALPGGGGAAPAYAVDVQKNGVVEISYDAKAKPMNTTEELAKLTSELRAAGIKIYQPQGKAGRVGCASFVPFAAAPDVQKSKAGAVVDGAVAGVSAKQYLHRGDTVQVLRIRLGKRQVYAVSVLHPNDCRLVRSNSPQATPR
ncbi:hypothetical protein AB0399_09560 [Streptomyces sp. NPDC088194]|uniref:hypothetical protein n=1 Tax=Streptomyces sp. NPDC088194 TaxID=3154931 RepID=UPI00344DFFF4